MDIMTELREIYSLASSLEDKGKKADYIPPLKEANINHLAIGLVGREEYYLGDSKVEYTMQSISKLISLTLALMDLGFEGVHSRVGFEGSSEAFNSLRDISNPLVTKPINPMQNPGAIVTSSLLPSGNRLDRIIDLIRRITNNPNITYDDYVYREEKRTGTRNKAIAYILKDRGFIDGDIEEVLDDYFKQCSIKLNTEDLGKLAYFYSSGGLVYGTGESLCSADVIRAVNAAMTLGGMYNKSGYYAAKVGLPSKSGVSGCILGVAPNRYGIALYSPGLDSEGNSLIGTYIMELLSRKFNLNIF